MCAYSERELLERARQFDRNALTEIYDCYSPQVYLYARRLLGDEGQAEECMLETFSRFLHALQAGNGPQEYLKAYLYRIAHNWITDQYRRQPPPPLELEEDTLVSDRQDTENQIDEQILQQQVRSALYRLTPEQRQVIVLKYIEGCDNQTIAAAINKPVGAVKSLQHRALDSLKRLLSQEGEVDYGGLSRAV